MIVFLEKDLNQVFSTDFISLLFLSQIYTPTSNIRHGVLGFWGNARRTAVCRNIARLCCYLLRSLSADIKLIAAADIIVISMV